MNQPAYQRLGKCAGKTCIRVFTDDGVKLGYAVRDPKPGRWIVCVYDGPAIDEDGFYSIENHRQISKSITSQAKAYDLIVGYHKRTG